MSLIKLHENSDEDILGIIHNLYTQIEGSNTYGLNKEIFSSKIIFYQNELQRRYIQRSLEATQEAIESSEKYNKSAQKAMKISIGAAIVSIFLAGFSIFSSTQWQNQQLPELKAINSNTKESFEIYKNIVNKQNSLLSILKVQKSLKKGGK